MKKHTAALLLTGAIVASALTVPTLAVKEGAKWGDIPLTKEKITIDGKMDEIYKKGLKITPDANSGGNTTATVYYLHDGKAVYLFAEIIDPYIMPISSDREKTFWEEDGIEAMFDVTNDGKNFAKITAHYDGFTNTAECRNGQEKNFTSAAVKNDKGYCVEVRFDLGGIATTGSEIGLNFINDEMTSENKRFPLRTKGGLSTNHANKPETFDYALLSATEVKNASAANPTAAATADVSSLALSAAALALAGFAVSKKKH